MLAELMLFPLAFVEIMMKKNLTVINKFHSHLESMKFIKPEEVYDQVSHFFN